MRSQFVDRRIISFQYGDKGKLFTLLNEQWQIESTAFGSVLSDHADLSHDEEPWADYDYILDNLVSSLIYML